MTKTPPLGVDTGNASDVDPGRHASVRDLRPTQPVPLDQAGYVAMLAQASRGVLSYPETMTLIGALLDRVDTSDVDRRLLRAETLLDVVEASLRVGDRIAGATTHLVGEAVAQDAAILSYGTSASSWLSHRFPLTRKQASAVTLSAQRAHPYPATIEAVEQGRVRPGQAAAVVEALRRLPTSLSLVEVDRAEQTMLSLAPDYSIDDLARLGNRLVEVIDPDSADDLLADRLARQDARAWTERYLELRSTGHGSMIVKGLLPEAEARQLVLQLDAVAAQHRRTALELRDPEAPYASLRTRRADALLQLSDRVAAHHDAPAVAGDRPRVVVQVTLDQLERLTTATHLDRDPLTGCVTDGGYPIPTGVIRRWLCDPDLQLLVTDASGRHTRHLSTAGRLADPKLRAALSLRDAGCVFPGCDVAPHLCDAHHIKPWVVQGPTEIDNLALLCPHHHRLLEPARVHPRDQWQMRMGADHLPEVIPPWRVDPHQRPVRQAPPIHTLGHPPVR